MTTPDSESAPDGSWARITTEGCAEATRVLVRPHVVSVSRGASVVYTFDRSGRLLLAYREDRTYRRGLDNRLVCRRRLSGRAEPVRSRLAVEETRALLDAIYGEIRTLATALARGRAVVQEQDPRQPAASWLTRLAAIDAAWLERDAARIGSLYRPVTILPPDQYLALVLQATEGCHYNRCSFCTFYRDRPYRVKSPAQLRAHIRALAAALGPGLAVRRSIFLGDANAVSLPWGDLVPLLDVVREELPATPGVGPRGIYAFMDVFSSDVRSAAEYRELAARGFRRLYLGVESGCRELLRFLRKPQEPGDAARVVAEIKAGGLDVGVIVMVGVGGDRFAASHLAETTALLNGLPWSGGDLLLLSDFVESPGADYGELARRADIGPLTPDALAGQRAALAAGVARRHGAPRVVPYGIDEFVY